VFFLLLLLRARFSTAEARDWRRGVYFTQAYSREEFGVEFEEYHHSG